MIFSQPLGCCLRICIRRRRRVLVLLVIPNTIGHIRGLQAGRCHPRLVVIIPSASVVDTPQTVIWGVALDDLEDRSQSDSCLPGIKSYSLASDRRHNGARPDGRLQTDIVIGALCIHIRKSPTVVSMEQDDIGFKPNFCQSRTQCLKCCQNARVKWEKTKLSRGAPSYR